MKRRYIAGYDTAWFAAADAAITAFSLTLAVAIRSGFAAFLVELSDIAVLAPVLIAGRFLSLLFFEQYAYRVAVWRPRDITSLAVYAFPATAILLAFRLLSPITVFSLPLSVIAVEYLMAVSLMILYRAYASQVRHDGNADHPRYRPRILVWGEIADIRRFHVIQTLESEDRYVIRGVLTPNPLFFDTDCDGYRVLGDESILGQLLLAEDVISTVIMVKPEEHPLPRLEEIQSQVKRFEMSLLVYEYNRTQQGLLSPYSFDLQ